MKLTYIIVVAFITYIVAEILKVIHVDSKFIPLINLVVGIIAAAVCFLVGILPMDTVLDIVAGLISCIIASCGAGGFYDVLKTKIKENEVVERPANEFNNDIVSHEFKD